MIRKYRKVEELETIKWDGTIESFEIVKLFFNDVKKEAEISELFWIKELDNIIIRKISYDHPDCVSMYNTIKIGDVLYKTNYGFVGTISTDGWEDITDEKKEAKPGKKSWSIWK